MSRAAFLTAERERRRRRPATAKQRRYLRHLAKRAGVEVPRVAWRDQASEAIDRLKHRLTQPTLGRCR